MEKEFETLKEIIKDNKVAMMTTLDKEAEIRSRPMVTTKINDQGVLWFFTTQSSTKAHEIRNYTNVNITYMNSSKEEYVSVSGHAVLVSDKNKIDDLWYDELNDYFENGKANPDIALIRVEPVKAEYWKSPYGLKKAYEFTKAFVNNEAYDEMENSENKKINF
jgi:general stress protein 26